MTTGALKDRDMTLTPKPLAISQNELMDILRPLQIHVKQRNYEGHDLFDGLNSRLLQATPLYKSELVRLAVLQLCKRSPINLRPFLMVPEGFDPSGGAFFLMGHLNLWQATGDDFYKTEADALFTKLAGRRLAREVGHGWGYNWDWQARAFFVSKNTPNLISSIYGGKAMLQYYKATGNAQALELAVGVARWIQHEMVKFETEDALCFRYVPGRDAEVHNANLKAAAYLTEVHQVSPLENAPAQIQKAVRFSTGDIRDGGYWPYGTKPFHQWMDNFHTAYNIQSLMTIMNAFELHEIQPTLEQVLDYYLTHLFTEDGIPKYYQNALYPIDSHVLAEVGICLTTLKQSTTLNYDETRLDVIEKRLYALVREFQGPEGQIYYLKTGSGWNRIPYIRWCQGKMFYALSRLIAHNALANVI